MPLWIVGAVVGVVLVVAGAVLLLRPGETKPTAHAPPVVPVPAGARLVAVLPFVSPTQDRPDLAAFAAAMTALVRRHAFCVRTLSVLTADESAPADETERRHLFTRAGREALLEAKLAEGAGGLVIEVESRRLTGSRTLGPYEGGFDALPTLAERIALDFAASLGLSPTDGERRAIESCRPSAPPSLMRLGMAMTAGQVGRATEICEQAIAEDRSFAPLYVELARVVGDANPERAAALLEQATSLDPDHAVPYWQLAMLWIFRFSGKSSAALAMAEQSIARAPAFGQARILHGNFLGLLGAPSEAQERRIAVELLPGSAIAWANQGKVLSRSSDVQGALVAFEKSLSIDDANSDALEGIVAVARTLGNHALALRWAERRMDVENPRAGARFGEEGGGDEAKFFSAAEDAIAAAQALGDEAAVGRVAKKALAVNDEFRAAKKALGK